MKKHSKLTGFFLSVFCTVLFFTGCSSNDFFDSDSIENMHSAIPSSNSDAFDAFNRLTREMFVDYAANDTLTLNYTLKDPSVYTIVLDEATWGHVPVTEDDFHSRKANTKNNLERLKSISYLSEDQRLTYDVLSYYLNLELEGYDYIYFTDHFSSMQGIQSNLPITMAEYHFDDVQDVEDYLILLNSVDSYFDQLIAFENEKTKAGYSMCASELRTTIEECQAFLTNPNANLLIEVFPSKLEHLNLSDDEKNTYIQANRDAVLNHMLPAYEKVVDALSSQLTLAPDSGSLSSYKNGTAYYDYLLRSYVGTDKTADELIQQTETNIRSSIAALSLLTAKNQKLLEEAGNTDFSLNDPEEILDHFKMTLTKEQFPEGPKVTCTLKNVHPSLSDSLAPAMCFIPRIDDFQNSQIYLNLNEDKASNSLMPTMAHEGYPGHLYQMTYYYHTNPDPIRTIYECLGYTEGWATYVESLCYDYCGFSEDLADFYRIFYHTLSMNLYCRIDLGIHYENWSYEDMAAYAAQFIQLDEAVFSELYEIILYNPVNYLVYGIGMNEIYELRKTMENTLGADFNIKDFHKKLLELGPAPFPVIEKYMFDDSSAKKH